MSRRKHIYRGLLPGEQVVWTGAPAENKFYGRIDRVLLPLSALALAFSTFYAMSLGFAVARQGFHARHFAAALILIAVGGLSVYGYFFRFIPKRRAKAELTYGVTSRGRVLICDHLLQKTYVYASGDLKQARITEMDAYGVGTIYLEPKRLRNLMDNAGLDLLISSDGRRIALFDVPDCEKVFRMIRRRQPSVRA